MRFAFALLVFATLLQSGCTFLHHSDQAIEDFFRNNRRELDQLVQLLNANRNVMGVTRDEIFYDDPSRNVPSREAISQIRGLLDQLSLKHGIHRDNERAIRFVVSSKHLFPRSEKGLLFSTEDLRPQVETLNEIELVFADEGYRYKRLNEYWYIYHENW